MSSLTTILALYGIVVLVTILIQVTAAAQKFDLSQLAGNRESLPSLTGTAGRLDRAQANSVVAMALFAPPVLMLTAKGQTKDRDLALALGANAYLTKPFSNAEMVATLRDVAGAS